MKVMGEVDKAVWEDGPRGWCVRLQADIRYRAERWQLRRAATAAAAS